MQSIEGGQIWRGILSVVIGTMLLFYALGIMQLGLSILLIVAALFAIGYGVYLSGLYDFINNRIKRTQQ